MLARRKCKVVCPAVKVNFASTWNLNSKSMSCFFPCDLLKPVVNFESLFCISKSSCLCVILLKTFDVCDNKLTDLLFFLCIGSPFLNSGIVISKRLNSAGKLPSLVT